MRDPLPAGLLELRRYYLRIPVAAPAAGADVTYTVPGGFAYQFVSLVGTLTSSAAAASRVVLFIVNDGTADVWGMAPANSLAASLAYRYWMQYSASDYALTPQWTDARMSGPVPLLLPGYVIKTSTTNLQAGDQWSAFQLYVEVVEVRPGPLYSDLGQQSAAGVIG